LRPRPPAFLAGSRGPAAAAAVAFLVAAYDGFFGPGTGTFLILGFTGLLGWSAVKASAEAKVVNASSNLAALAVFAAGGSVAWGVALPMAAAQVAGGFLGAHVALRKGDRLVRGFVAAVVVALVAKLALDLS
ncbi:MAG: TSUP family transporter, partial [Planctomycetaceae bacterium]|nr:TSUP family transporter [Planctomycetaceae bacterium]